MENLLRTGFERRMLWKMENQHSYYNKDISWSPQLFQKTDIVRENVSLRAIDRKLTLNLIVIFNSFTDISFLKYVTKIFCISYYFQEKIWECFKVQLSVTLFVYILSSKGTNQLQVLYIKTLGNIQGNFSTEAAVLKCIPSIFFLEIWGSFRAPSEKLALENFVLAYHRTDRITPMFCKLSSLVFLCVFGVLCKSKS